MEVLPEKTVVVFEFSLCLSRACLGKKIAFMYKWLKTTVFAYASCWRCTSCSCWPVRRTRIALFDVFPRLRLSRACLGKLILFGIKTAQKWRVPYLAHRRGEVAELNRLQEEVAHVHARVPGEEKRSCFLSFPYLCLSRACLGKTVVFSIKSGGNDRRRPSRISRYVHDRWEERLRPAQHVALAGLLQVACRNALFFKFSYVCPEPVVVKCSTLV
jgi:hypothetical protein